MKNSIFIGVCLCIIIILLFLNLIWNSNQNRYDLYVVQGHPGELFQTDYAVKIDKKTGRIWSLSLKVSGFLFEPTICELGIKDVTPLLKETHLDTLLRSVKK